MERKHIVADGVLHIGKEANSVDEQALDVKRSQVFVNELELREFIQNISYSDWVKLGYSKRTLHNLKQDAQSGKSFTMNAHVRERILSW